MTNNTIYTEKCIIFFSLNANLVPKKLLYYISTKSNIHFTNSIGTFSVNLTSHIPSLKSCVHFYCWRHSTKFIKVQGPMQHFHNMLIYYGEKLLPPTNSISG